MAWSNPLTGSQPLAIRKAFQSLVEYLKGLQAEVDAVELIADAIDTDVSTHLADTDDAHDASAISYAGGTGMSATDVEAGLDELATEKADKESPTFTGQVLMPDGSLSAPGIGFSGDTNTGIRRFDDVDQYIDMVINGVFRTRWYSAGATSFVGGTEATLADATGEVQIGDDGAPNLGIDATEIQARDGAAAASTLSLNPHGGDVTVGGVSAATEDYVDAAETAHEAEADPHPGYLLESDYQGIPNDDATPAAPTGLALEPSFDQILAHWTLNTEIDMVDGFGNYQVQLDTVNTFDSVGGQPLWSLKTDAQGMNFYGLDTGTTYYVRVRAIDAHGNQSSWSSTVSISTISIDPGAIDVWALSAEQYIRSADYDGTDFDTNDATEGWNIDPGGIEAKNLRARGTIEALGPELLTNTDFDANITGWGGDVAGKTWQFFSTVESWVAWSTTTVGHVTDTEKVLEEGALELTVGASPTYGLTGAESPTDTGLTVGERFSVTATVKPTLSSTGPIAGFVQVKFKDSGGSVLSTINSDFQSLQDGEWSEIHSDILTVPTSCDRYTVGLYFTQSDESTALTASDTISVGLVGAQKPSITTVAWDNTKSASGAGSLKATPSAAGSNLVHFPDGDDPADALAVTAGDLLYFSFKYQTEETAWPYDRVLPVFFYYNDSDAFVGMLIGEFVQAGSTSEWTPGYAVTKVPSNATKVRAGIGWLSSAANQDVWIDEASLAVPSQVSGAVIASGPPGFPRAELRSGGRGTTDSTPRVILYGSGLEERYDPAELYAGTNPITDGHDMQRPWTRLTSPLDRDNWNRAASLLLFPGKAGNSGSDTAAWAFNALPMSFRGTKSGGASTTSTWNQQTGWTKTWSVVPGAFSESTGTFTCPDWAVGLWLFYARVDWAAHATGNRRLRFVINGANQPLDQRRSLGSGAATIVSAVYVARMGGGETAYVESLQTSGTNLNYGSNYFAGIYLGGYSGVE